MKILLFIPMYNCENQIVRVLNNIYSNDLQNFYNQLILVDNQSKDNSLTTARNYLIQHDIKASLIVNRENYGLGGSHKVAFNYMIENHFDYIIVLHGDDQADAKDIFKFLEIVKSNKYDKIMGSRFMEGSSLNGYSITREYGNIIINLLASFMLNFPIKDLGSGLNMYSRQFVINNFFKTCSDSLTFNNHLLFCDMNLKNNSTFIPIKWSEKDQVSNANLFKQAKEIVVLILRRKIKSFIKNFIIHKDLCSHKVHYFQEIRIN